MQKKSSASFVHTLFQRQKTAVACAAVVVLSAILLGAITLVPAPTASAFRLQKGLQLFAFLAAGTVYARFFHKRLTFFTPGSPHGLVYSAGLFVFVFLVLTLLYFLTGQRMLWLAVGSGCAFILPFTVTQSWLYYNGIPESVYPVWHPSPSKTGDNNVLFLNTIPVTLRVAVKETESRHKSFTVKVPPGMTLGEVFNYLILLKSKIPGQEIEIFDAGGKPFGWRFYAASTEELLDPESSLKDNKIKANATVIAQRVKEAEDDLASSSLS